MPSGRNQVYGPSNAPVFDPDPIVGNRKVYVAGNTSLPPFSVTGAVDGTGESPSYPIRQSGSIRLVDVTVEDAAGTSVDFDIKVNGGVAASFTASSAGLVQHSTSIPVVVNDLVSVEVTDMGSGDLFNLLIVMRL